MCMYFYFFFMKNFLNLYTHLIFNYFFYFPTILLEKSLLSLLLFDNGMTSWFNIDFLSFSNFLL
jgi:hypothetical protein